MYGSAYVFSKPFFVGWIIVSLLWAFFSFGAVVLFPIFEGRHTILSILKGFVGKTDSYVPKGDQEKFDSQGATPETGSVDEVKR